jgi:GNAT superfamily N-acetyltransferase
VTATEFELRLEWSASRGDEDVDEPITYLDQITGDVVAHHEGAPSQIAGRFNIYYVDCDGALNAGVSLFDVMDHDQEIHNYYAALIDMDKGEFREEVVRATGSDFLVGNILVLDRLELLPPYRGSGQGLALLRAMIRSFGRGAGLVAMLPFPSQFGTLGEDASDPEWRDKMQLTVMKRKKSAAIKRLHTYYAALGFRDIPGTEYMVCATDSVIWRDSHVISGRAQMRT